MHIWLANWLILSAFRSGHQQGRGVSILKSLVAGASSALFTLLFLSCLPGEMSLNGEIVRRTESPFRFYASLGLTGAIAAMLVAVTAGHLYRAFRPGEVK